MEILVWLAMLQESGCSSILALNIRRPDEKKNTGRPRLEVEDQVGYFLVALDQGSVRGLTDLPASKEVGEPKQPFLC